MAGRFLFVMVASVLAGLSWAGDGSELFEAVSEEMERGNKAGARELVLRTLRDEPDSLIALSILGALEYDLGNFEAAEAALKRTIELGGQFPTVYRSLARIYERREDWPAAIEALRHAVELEPDNADSQGFLGFMLLRAGRYAELVGPMSAYVRANPDDAIGHFRLGIGYFHSGRHNEAAEELRRGMSLEDDELVRLDMATMLAEEALDIPTAKKAARSSLQSAAAACRTLTLGAPPEDYRQTLDVLLRSYRVLATAAVAEGDPSRADFVSGWYTLHPSRVTAERISRVLARRGRLDEAFMYYARTINPHDLLKVTAKTVPSELRAWVDKTFPTDAALRFAVKEHTGDREEEWRLRPKSGELTMPKGGVSNEGTIVKARVLVDENGKIRNALFLEGKEPFLSAARTDLPRLAFEPIGPLGSRFASLRALEFFYLPMPEVRARWSFDLPPRASTRATGTTQKPLAP